MVVSIQPHSSGLFLQGPQSLLQRSPPRESSSVVPLWKLKGQANSSSGRGQEAVACDLSLTHQNLSFRMLTPEQVTLERRDKQRSFLPDSWPVSTKLQAVGQQSSWAFHRPKPGPPAPNQFWEPPPPPHTHTHMRTHMLPLNSSALVSWTQFLWKNSEEPHVCSCH